MKTIVACPSEKKKPTLAISTELPSRSSLDAQNPNRKD
jgi:hypothetical protein